MKSAKGAEPSDLRRRAARLVPERTNPPSPASQLEMQRLLLELEVHQMQLQVQNRQLDAARLEVDVSLQLYTELFDFAPIGYAVLSPNGAVQKVNLEAARLLGLEHRSRVRGRAFVSFVAWEDQSAFENLLLVLTTEEEAEADRRELKLRRPDGAIHVQLTATILRAAHPSVLIAIEDITERKRRQEWERTESALREANRQKDEFLAALSHELRNPLAPIRTGLDLLKGEAMGERAAKVVHTLDRQVVHLSRLIEDLLDVTRISRGKLDMRLELRDLVFNTMMDHRSTFEQRGVDLDSRLDPGPLWVDADPARLTQALSNLLTNAAKFTPRGGRVTVSLEDAGTRATIRVRDTGRGIAPEMLSRIFEPFTQAPQTADRSHGGLGLGLAVARGFVEAFGGTIGGHSAGLGKGAEFVVSLPVMPPPAATAPAKVPAPPSGRRVLLVEDNRDTAELLAAGLALSGHEVRAAADGLTGLEVARSLRPEVVICDIGLPQMDGFSVARAFRADDALKDVWLIALSGYALPEDLRRAHEAGFNVHVCKPASLDELNRLLAEAPLPTRSRASSCPGP
jgi:two-component system CheB/CheR fusion protein